MRSKYLLFSIIALALIALTAAPARALTVEELQQQMQSLLQQLNQLKAKLQAPSTSFLNDLYVGIRNSAEVKRLQSFLISKGHLDIGLDTGNFFGKTREALRNYQSAVGITPTGYFGPLTRARIQQELAATTTPAGFPPPVPQVPHAPPVPAVASSTTRTSSEFQIVPKPAYNFDQLALQIHDAINRQRISFGLQPLAWNGQVARMALLHSQDQVADNVAITDANLLCSYPLIRHEEFATSSIGYSLRDRLLNQGILYHSAGENIAMVPLSKDVIYQYPADQPPPACPNVPDFPPESGERSAREALYRSVLQQSRDAVAQLRHVQFVNRDWLTHSEAAQKAVDGWMNSPGHRANILQPDFTQEGIAVATVNDYVIITQNFIRP